MSEIAMELSKLTVYEKIEWSETLLSGNRATYEEAQAAVAALGDGWRLPTRAELESIIDLSRHYPAIDLEKFPDTKSAPYWTGTPCAWNDKARWVVYFGYGFVQDYLQSSGACVRAVRKTNHI